MSNKKNQNYSKRPVNKNNQKNPWSKNDKYIVKETSFEDLELLLSLPEHSNSLIKTAFGSFTFDSLTEQDIGKHVAIFVDYKTMPEWFFNKKFDKGNAKNSINDCNIAFEQSSKDYAHLIPKGAFITAEMMNQNREYAKSDKPMSIVLHGSIICSVPPEIITFQNLEQLCEAYKMEGFVVVNTETSSRFKLKHGCFPKGDVGKGQHMIAPKVINNDFTDNGLILCDNGKSGYHVAALANTSERQTIATKNINGFETQLIVIPNDEAIWNQVKNPFDGDKMINLFDAIGEGTTYRYTEKYSSSESVDNLVLHKKFDGESVLLHVDDDVQFHMLIRFNMDALKVECANGESKIRFGWMKK